MDDITILEAVERYISGSMSPDERVYFEQLRKTNPEIDQLVVEHTFFMQQLNRYDETKAFKSQLNDVHNNLGEKGVIQSPKLVGRAKIVHLFNRYKRTGAIAACIAGFTAITITVLTLTVSPNKPATKNDIQYLNGQINALKNQTNVTTSEINKVKAAINTPTAPAITYKTGGTGFLIDAKGFLITNAHVVGSATDVAVQNNAGVDLAAKVVYVDAERDIAILKINDSSFKAPAALPYTIRRTSADIAEPVFTLGFPRTDMVYGEGYLAARTGFNGDTLTCQIAIAANPGNSGGPVLNKNGEVIGVLSAKQRSAEGVVFATQSKYIYKALAELKKQDSEQNVKLPTISTLKGMDRTQQVKRVSECVFMVKVS